jgi:hypothetical protein
MHLVFKDKHGDIKWGERFEVESIESFIKQTNKRAREVGSSRDIVFAHSDGLDGCVRQLGWDGKIEGTYHLCASDVCRLL